MLIYTSAHYYKQQMTNRYLSAALVILSLISNSHGTPLDDYVYAPDDHYSYKEIASFRGPDYTMYTYNMTSQKWKDESILDHPVWWHYLTITIPDKVVFDSAFLFIDGGSNGHSPPSVTDTFVALTTTFAASTGAIGADLKMVPNQPLVFYADPEKRERKEDAIIAWTWKTFVLTNSSDPEFLLRMPMTKAAVRALDTITSVAMAKVGKKVDKFMVGGASKNLHHHYRSLGGWTFAFDDYYDLNVTRELDNPNTQKMANIIDPISYNDRFINKPKYIITTGGDEFFIPDDSDYFFDQLNGPKYLRCNNQEFQPLQHIRGRGEGMNLSLKWTGLNCRRDFRLLRGTPGNPHKPQVHPVIWLTQDVTFLGNGMFEAEFENPKEGWLAFFIQVTFPGLMGSVLEFTTEAMIIPNTFPFEDCHGEECLGELV